MSSKCPKCGAITTGKFCAVCGTYIKKRFRFLKVMGWIVASIMLIVILVHFIGNDIEEQYEDYKNVCYVKVNVANIRSGPGKDNKIITKARGGDRIKSAITQDDWIKIKTSQGQEGWIHSSLVSDSRPKKEPAPSLSRARNKALDEISQNLEDVNNSGRMYLWVEAKLSYNILTIIVSDEWYGFDKRAKEKMAYQVGDMFAQIACKHKLRKRCDSSDYPVTLFLNQYTRNKVAEHNLLKTKVYE